MEIALTITGERQLAAVTAAREARNAMLAADAGSWPSDPAGTCDTDADYVRFVLEQAVESWAVQHVG